MNARELRMTPEQLEAEKARVLAAREARKRRTAPKRAPGAAKKKATKKERRERMAAIRVAVMERAGGKCEWCGAEHMTLEAHHVLQGSGTRRAEERPETVAAVCWDCHRKWHRADYHTGRDAKEWALRLFLSDALREIERRTAGWSPLAQAVRP